MGTPESVCPCFLAAVLVLLLVLSLVLLLVLSLVLILILVVHGITSIFLLRNTALLGCPQI